MGVIDDGAMDKAECTLLIQHVTYRDANGAEQKAFRILPWGKIKYAVAGEQQEYTVPVTISFDGINVSTEGAGQYFKLENHSGIVSADGGDGGMHELSQL